MPGAPYPAETRERALDLVAAEVAANGGTVPHGAYARAAGVIGGVHRKTVRGWWAKKLEEGERETRCNTFARRRERLRDSALNLAATMIEGFADDIEDGTMGPETRTRLLGTLQRISDGVEDGDALQQINLLINHGALTILDEPPPPPQLPDGMVIEATDDGD